MNRPASAEALQRLAEAPLRPPPMAVPKLPAGGKLLPFLHGEEFVRGFIPPDYLIDGILQKGFIYSNTGQTGAGKTAIALRIALSIGDGRDLGDRLVKQGRVLFCAGENPDDIRMRWIAMAAVMNFDPAEVDVYFLDGAVKISETEGAIRAKMEAVGSFECVVIDTSAAFYEGADENDNVAMLAHARRLRSLTTLPGKPTVLVNCHPVKNAAADNLLPRGGGSFLNEMDGNLTSAKKEEISELHWQGKFRGPDFSPIAFKLQPVKTPTLIDSKGRQVPTVAAEPITASEKTEMELTARNDEDAVLLMMDRHDGASLSTIAELLGWLDGGGKAYKVKVQRIVKSLARDRLTKLERKNWIVTDKGHATAKKLLRAA